MTQVSGKLLDIFIPLDLTLMIFIVIDKMVVKEKKIISLNYKTFYGRNFWCIEISLN
jgi:hypothetical protein